MLTRYNEGSSVLVHFVATTQWIKTPATSFCGPRTLQQTTEQQIRLLKILDEKSHICEYCKTPTE